MNKEYIERDVLSQHKRKMRGFDLNEEFWDEAVLCEDIEKAPIADVVPVKHGEWIGKKYNWDNEYNPPKIKDSHYLECSNCGNRHPLYNYNVWTNTLTRCAVFTDELKIPNYCPDCGACMDGGNE